MEKKFWLEVFIDKQPSTNHPLTYPSGWSLISNFFRLNDIFLILAHENVLIRVIPWKTASPMWATARLSGTPSWSLAACIFIPYSSQRRAVSSRFRSASPGDCPLFNERRKSLSYMSGLGSLCGWLTHASCGSPWCDAALNGLVGAQIDTKTSMYGRDNPHMSNRRMKL